MSYLLVENFNLGMDRRRPRYASFNGAIWKGVNCHLTRGGDLEKRKAFAQKFDLTGLNTFGLLAANGVLYTFGSVSPPTMPSGITYQRLQHPDGLAMSSVLAATVYDGKTYVVAKYSDNSVYHFYNGGIVGSFSDGIVRSTFATNAGIAAHIKGLMDAQSSATYTFAVASNVITITHKTNNVAFTLTKYAVTAAGVDVSSQVSLVTTQAATASLPQISTVTFSFATPSAGDRVAITIAGVEHGAKSSPLYTPNVVATFRSKVYGLAQSLLEFSGVGNPQGWNTVNNTGASYINLATMDSGSAQLTGIGIYQGNLALFARRTVQIWYIREDQAQNSLMQTLKNTGTIASKSVAEYGDIDVFYLDDSGIRSIRARAPSNAAFVNDIGTTLDSYIREYKRTLTDTQIAAACATIEPLDGRYMLALGNYVFVLSYFPSSQISGWTMYDVGFQITDWSVLNDRVYARSGEIVYLYGGDDNNTYDSSVVTVEMPFLTGGKPDNAKQFNGIDVSAIGTWDVDVLVDPRDENRKVRVGSLDGISWNNLNATAFAYATHIAPVLTCTSSGYASLSQIGVGYEGGAEN